MQGVESVGGFFNQHCGVERIQIRSREAGNGREGTNRSGALAMIAEDSALKVKRQSPSDLVVWWGMTCVEEGQEGGGRKEEWLLYVD